MESTTLYLLDWSLVWKIENYNREIIYTKQSIMVWQMTTIWISNNLNICLTLSYATLTYKLISGFPTIDLDFPIKPAHTSLKYIYYKSIIIVQDIFVDNLLANK
jgi:hypothetical protein